MKTKQLHRNGSLWTSPSNTLTKYTGLLCCVLELTAGAKLPSFPPNLRGTFHAHPGDQAHSYESISRSPCFNYCTTGIIKSRGNYGNIIPRINTTISPSTFFPHKQMKNREYVGLIASLVSITNPMDGRVQKSFNYVESFLAQFDTCSVPPTEEAHVDGQPQNSLSLNLGTIGNPNLGFWKFTRCPGSAFTRRVRVVGRGNSLPLKWRTSWWVGVKYVHVDQSIGREKDSLPDLPIA